MHPYTIGRLRGGLCVTWPDDTIPSGRRRYALRSTTRRAADAEARDLDPRS